MKKIFSIIILMLFISACNYQKATNSKEKTIYNDFKKHTEICPYGYPYYDGKKWTMCW